MKYIKLVLLAVLEIIVDMYNHNKDNHSQQVISKNVYLLCICRKFYNIKLIIIKEMFFYEDK